MRSITIPIEQRIINKINSKVDFTHPEKTKRYIVGIKNLHTSKNPSLKYVDIYKDVYAAVKNNKGTIGGWNKNGLYYVDLGLSFDHLEVALLCGKKYNQQAIYDSKEDKVINLK